MRAVRFSRFGRASEVAELVDIEEPGSPGPDEALVEVNAAPINPSDLLHFSGKYGGHSGLPAFAGGGVSARVLEVGDQVSRFTPGDRVIALSNQRNAWRDRFVCSTRRLIPVPDADPVTLGLLSANPPTALLMLDSFVSLRPGDWVIQNAANSSVGISLIQIAHSLGLKTANVVRRADVVDQLRGFGADEVIMDGPDLPTRVAAAIGDDGAKLGIDAVAGAATGRLAKAVSSGGTIITYGLLSGEPCQVDPADIVFRDVRLQGFWYSRWFDSADAEAIEKLFARLVHMSKSRSLNIPVEAVYEVEDLTTALAHAEKEKRAGKVVLRWN